MAQASPKKLQWRGLLLQALALLVVVSVIGFIVQNTVLNLEARGIASGFGFLSQPAGFDLAFHLLPYDESSTFGWVFIIALLNTLLVSAIGVVLASILGVIVALMRLSHNPLMRMLGGFYVETLRNVPLLLQLFFWYFAVLRNLPGPRESLEFLGAYLNNRGLSIPFPEESEAALYVALALVLGLIVGHYARQLAVKRRVDRGRYPVWHLFPYAIPLLFPLLTLVLLGPHWQMSWPELQGFNFSGGLQLIPEFVALALALSLYTAAFVAEIVRAGILSVQKGQMEASQALGLMRLDAMRLVILPQALRVILPPLTSQYLNLVKNSSLAAAIAFPDLVLVFSGTAINITGQAVEIMAMVMMVYLLLSLSISAVMNRYQKKTLHYLGQRS
jgi:general L-amino acid transport system permease protein